MSVRYEAVNAMLLNEFLKEHRKVQNWRRRRGSSKNRLRPNKRLLHSGRSKLKRSQLP
jgi:hypothetical protein